MTTNAFGTLRAQLRVPYHDEPYHKALERAEAEAVATREAVLVWVDAVIQGANATDAISELHFWLHQARCARVRLERVRERKRNASPV